MIELESMLPWERLIHVDQIKAIVRVEYERARELERANGIKINRT